MSRGTDFSGQFFLCRPVAGLSCELSDALILGQSSCSPSDGMGEGTAGRQFWRTPAEAIVEAVHVGGDTTQRLLSRGGGGMNTASTGGIHVPMDIHACGVWGSFFRREVAPLG